MNYLVFDKRTDGSFELIGTGDPALKLGNPNVYIRLPELRDSYHWYRGDFTPLATEHVPKELLLLYLLIKDS